MFNVNSVIDWRISRDMLNLIASKDDVVILTTHFNRFRTDMINILKCLRDYPRYMSKIENVLYTKADVNIGRPCSSSNDYKIMFDLFQPMLPVISGDVSYSIRVYLQENLCDRTIETVLCEITPVEKDDDIETVAEYFATIFNTYLQTICPAQYNTWDFVITTEEIEKLYTENNMEVQGYGN